MQKKTKRSLFRVWGVGGLGSKKKAGLKRAPAHLPPPPEEEPKDPGTRGPLTGIASGPANAFLPTCDATPRALDPEVAPGVPGLWRKRDLSETVPASVTHQLRAPPFLSAPCHFQACTTLSHAVRDVASLTCLCQPNTRASCQLQVEHFGTEATHPSPPRASWCRTG